MSPDESIDLVLDIGCKRAIWHLGQDRREAAEIALWIAGLAAESIDNTREAS